jgi:septal ring factor EnvC (AmiA/AmiB activator)
MNLKKALMSLFFSKDLEKLNDQLEEISKENKNLLEKIESMKSTISDNSRALATLAIIQSRLINEISDLVESNQREKKKKPAIRKNPGPEFTN